jgi:hypothetical protein
MFWYLMGDFMRNLQTWKIPGTGWFAGIPHDVKDSGGKSFGKNVAKRANQPSFIARYGWIMEEGGTFHTSEGTQYHPARPLFHPALIHFELNIAPLELNKVIPQIERQWS